MKKIFLLTLVLALLLSASPALAQANDMSPSQLAYTDAQVDILLPRLEQYQAQYYYRNGQYYQALVSHSTAPNVPTPPDGLSNAPTDQLENLAYFWDVFATLPEELSWSFSIDTYSGPDGDGYVLNVETVINGETWKRAVNYGPDSWRAADWYLVVPFNF
jgi:hypothetical protein